MTRKKRVEWQCLICGKKELKRPSQARIRKYCSPECSAIAHSGPGNPVWKDKEIVKCETCGKSFRLRGPSKASRFCSLSCYWQVMPHKFKKGNNSGRKFEKGNVPWNKGKGHSEETKHKISEIRKGWNPSPEIRAIYSKAQKERFRTQPHPMSGTKMSEETKRKLSLANKGRMPWNTGLRGFLGGEKHYNWQGGITPKNIKERIQFRYYFQKKVFERDNYSCVLCGSRGELHVDHIKPWAKYPELRFNLDNCQTLCKSCHYQLTFGRSLSDSNVMWGRNFRDNL